MELSERILKVKPSVTLEITALANSMKAEGIDVIGFGSGEPDFDTPDSIKGAAIKAIEDGKTKYTPVGGLPQLKEAIANKFKRDNNLSFTSNEVTVNCGGKHSFYNLMQVLLNKGDEVIIPAPYWVSYPPIVTLAEGKPIIVETSASDNYKITPDKLKKAITSKTKAFVLNSPSNPTGSAYSETELKELAEVLIKEDILIISDDIYESITYDDFKFTNIASFSEELKKKTIVLNGVSKTYSMTGWRIGYMAGDASIIKKVETLQSQSTSNPTSISQWAAIEAINGDQEVVQKMVEAFSKRREMIVDGLNAIPGTKCISPDGSFYAFPDISGAFDLPGWSKIEEKYDNEFNSSKMASYLLKESQVAVVPGIAFGTDSNMRLSFATSEENITNGLDRINKAIEKLA